MDLGILERIESKLDVLINQEPTPSNLVTLDEPEVTSSTPEAPIVTQDVPEEELDALGFKWDKRIHSVKKSKTATGIWKKVRGCDKELYDRIMEEQTSQDSPQPSEVPEPTVSAPPMPKKKTAPPPPPAPSVGSDPYEEDKQKAMSSISELTASYEISFDRVLKELPEGIVNFDSLPKEQYKDFALKVKTWVDWLGMCNDENSKIHELGGQDAIDGMQIIYGYYDGATRTNQISPENLPTVYESLKEYRDKWEAIQ